MHVQSTVSVYLPTQFTVQPFLVPLSRHTPHSHIIPPWLPPSLDRGRREAPGWCHRLPKRFGEPQWKIRRKQTLGPRNRQQKQLFVPSAPECPLSAWAQYQILCSSWDPVPQRAAYSHSNGRSGGIWEEQNGKMKRKKKVTWIHPQHDW